MDNRSVELLAPAGNMECLKTALYFGADAVYLAGQKFGLRAFAQNFTLEELKDAVHLAHSLGKKIYVTVNALFRNDEIVDLKEYLIELKNIEVDAVILSDPGAVTLAKQTGHTVHLSTQASTCNYLSAAFWYEQGVSRIVMARELSLKEIHDIRELAPFGLEIEAFIHGAMCVAYSGRCLLSSVLTGRSGNKGECAQPCRWEYTIHENGYPDDYFPIQEDERGTYILNSKDLMMIEHIPDMIDAGIQSFKIEGRMKSAYYVACVVNAYRKAIDEYLENPDKELDRLYVNELIQSATRNFTTGFFYGNPKEEGQDIHKDLSKRDTIVCALVTGERNADGYLPIEQRNKFWKNDILSVLSPSRGFDTFPVECIMNEDDIEQESAPHPQQQLKIKCPYDLHPGDFLRRNIKPKEIEK